MNQSYQITGMTCEGCRKIVTNCLLNVEDIHNVEVDMKNERALIYSGNQIPIATLQEALEETAYKISASVHESGTAEETLAEQFRKIITDYVLAVGQFDYDALRICLHPEFKFDGGLQTNSAEGYINMLMDHSGSSNAGILGNEIKGIFIEDKEAYVIYDMLTSKPVAPVTFMQHIIFDGHKLTSTKMKFERPKMEKLIAAIKMPKLKNKTLKDRDSIAQLENSALQAEFSSDLKRISSGF